MYTAKILPISGHRDLQVPNTFLRQAEETRHLVVIFPGRGYSCEMPLLYYTARPLLAQGADVLCVEYAYHRRIEFEVLPEAAQEHWFLADVRAALQAGLAQRPYAELTLVGKSLGTRALGHLLTAEPPVPATRVIWLTPLLRQESLRAQMRQSRQPALYVIGTADPHYDAAVLAALRQETGAQVMEIAGADHSLEIEGHVGQSLGVLEQILRAVAALVSR